MRTVAEVRLWGKTVGTVSLQKGEQVASFEYDPGFLASGLDISPLMVPLRSGTFKFTNISQETYRGLPGLLADSLPDKFGTALLDVWLMLQGRGPVSVGVVERLRYTGARGMGALEFAPSDAPEPCEGPFRLDSLVLIASQILLHRKHPETPLPKVGQKPAFRDILAMGTAVGGSRAKILVCYNPETEELRCESEAAAEGFEPWLLKLDGVAGNRDKEDEDPSGFGAVEYAYFLMAIDAGITMNNCRLVAENGRRHFMTKRFDRLPGGGKCHMQSLCALAHFDLNRAGRYSYEQVFKVMSRLGLPWEAMEEQFRRMVFNIVARNQDDHAKNIAFLMDLRGTWSLAPAFDVTYSYNPVGTWTARHQMTMNGKRDGFALQDFSACAQAAAIQEKKAETIVREVSEVVARWQDYAEEVGVSNPLRELIGKNLRIFKRPVIFRR